MSDVALGGRIVPDLIYERTAGLVARDTFLIYIRHFWTMLVIVALPQLPLVLVLSLPSIQAQDGWLLGLTAMRFVISIFAVGALTVAVSDVCMGNQPSVRRSYAGVFRSSSRYFGTYLLYILLLTLGMILLVVPGVIASVIFMFALPACVIERRKVLQSFRRSRQLGRGMHWRNFGVVLILVFFQMLVFIALIFFMTLLLLLGLSESFLIGQSFTFNFAFELLGLLPGPVLVIGLVLLYYDMRVRKENYDSTALAQELMA